MELANQIVRWFRENGREFPWRETDEPYEILIGELMLQKTSASQVLPVYRELIEKYPSPENLSQGDVEEIAEIIYSLGLQNTRAARLKKFGKKVVEEFDGEIPSTEQDLKKLPGVGDYIANAVLCLAFGKSRPMMDANFGRVFGRVYQGKEDYSLSEDIRNKVEEIMPDEEPRKFNLGVLDLGASICRPQNPLCQECPLSDLCKYFQERQRYE